MGTAIARTGTPERHRSPAPARTPAPARDVAATAPCTPGFDVAANAATLRVLLADADAGTRVRLAGELQRRHGNTAVQRLLDPAGGIPVQRWAVGLPPGTTDCARVVGYLNAASPHRADSGWAKTSVRFAWGGDPAYSEADGVITATVSNPTVTMTKSVDMPQWAPTNPAMARAWGAMTGDLRAHESRHEDIAVEWESTLRSNLGSLSVTVPNRTIGAFRSAVQAAWNGWIAQHQAAQRAIDPYTAVLDCSAEASESEAESEESTEVTGEVSGSAAE